MQSADANVIDAALIERWALSYLDRYASSGENLRRVLLRRVRRRGGDDAALRAANAAIDALLDRYRAVGLIDDAAYAAARARNGVARGQSLHRIVAGLRQKGIVAEDAATAVAALREDDGNPDLRAACAYARRRRLGPYRRDRAAAAERQRELAAFARAGFAREVALAVLACADAAAVDALLADATG